MLNFVIVVGSQRSGTTLVGQVLGAHPEAVLIDETDGLYKWVEARMADPESTECDRLFKSCLSAASSKYKINDRRLRFTDERELRPEIEHLILKAPNLTYSSAAIRRSFRSVSVIYLIRDIRDIVASMKKLSHIRMVENQLKRMKACPEIASRFSREIALIEAADVARHIKMATVARVKTSLLDSFEKEGLDVLPVRYEDLVDDLEGECRLMTEHAGMSFSELCLRHDLIYRGLGPGFTERSRPVDRHSIAAWTARLSPREEQGVWDTVGGFMESLGYRREVARKPMAWKSIAGEKLDNPVVALGRGGSGTRLLGSLLLELGVFLGNRRNKSIDSLEWVGLIYEMTIKSLRGSSSTETPPWRALAREKAGEILNSGEWDGRSRWGWKLPETTLVAPEIASVFENAQFVHLVRHPVDACLRRTHRTSRRDNAVGASVLNAAYRRLGWSRELMSGHEPYLLNAASWLYQVESLVRFGRQELGPERYLEVRYEDICAEPERVFERLKDFLGISSGPLVEDLGINPSRLRAWTPPDPRAEEVWRICAGVARELGYRPPELGPDQADLQPP